MDVVDVPIDVASSSGMAAAAAAILVGTVDRIEQWRPDIVLVLGDRWEMLAIAQACQIAAVPLAHLHGGEVTAGSTDDAVRHALTKLSHVHLVATAAYAQRVRQLGEEPWRVHVVGAPALDRLRVAVDDSTEAELEQVLGGSAVRPTALVTYHPPTNHPERLESELASVVAGCAACSTVLATYPGADPGADRIIDVLRTWAARDARVILVPSLGRLYPRALATVDVVVGNSSSGIVEAPFFGVPVVNVGARQDGRVRAAAVIDAPGTDEAVVAAVARAIDPAFRKSLPIGQSPYGDGEASGRIVDVLHRLPMRELLAKQFVDTEVHD